MLKSAHIQQGSYVGNSAFHKRTYTLAGFLGALRETLAYRNDLRQAVRGGRISRAFAEKIMLAVTQVNDCRYCSYGHSYAALRAGVPQEEIDCLLAGDTSSFPDIEAEALAFARHYAESGGRPEPAAWERLKACYGPEAAADILTYIRLITIGNLSGNTLDAFVHRLKGRPAPESRLGDELGVILAAAGALLLPAGALLWIALKMIKIAIGISQSIKVMYPGGRRPPLQNRVGW